MPENYKIQSRRVSFRGFDGSHLAATLEFPVDVVPTQYAIISHCFTCTQQTLTTFRLSRGLAQAGIATLRFDFTGLGESEGSFADTHFRSMIQDIECAASFLSTHYQAPDFLLGHSMGGTASLAASQSASKAFSRIEKVVTLASPSYPAHVLHHFGDALEQLEQGIAAEIWVAGKAYSVKPSFVNDVRSYNLREIMQGCEKGILAVRAGDDELVSPEAADQILAMTQGEKKLVQVEHADHLFSDRNHAAQLLSEVTGWLRC